MDHTPSGAAPAVPQLPFHQAPIPEDRHECSKRVEAAAPALYRAMRLYVFTGNRDFLTPFAEAVLANDLQEAFEHASDAEKEAMPALVEWVSLFPDVCTGSRVTLDSWELYNGLSFMYEGDLDVLLHYHSTL